MDDIEVLLKDAQERKVIVAYAITGFRVEINTGDVIVRVDRDKVKEVLGALAPSDFPEEKPEAPVVKQAIVPKRKSSSK